MSLKAPLASPMSSITGMAAVLLPTDENRRFAQRKPRSLPATLLSDRLQSQVPCIVRDLSSTGARIEVVAGRGSSVRLAEDLPERVTLYMVTDEMEVDCEVVRREGAFAGVRFISTSRLRPRQKARTAMKGSLAFKRK